MDGNLVPGFARRLASREEPLVSASRQCRALLTTPEDMAQITRFTANLCNVDESRSCRFSNWADSNDVRLT